MLCVQWVPTCQIFAHSPDHRRINCIRVGCQRKCATYGWLLVGNTAPLEGLGLPLIEHLGAICENVANISNKSQKAVCDEVLSNALSMADSCRSHGLLEVLHNI